MRRHGTRSCYVFGPEPGAGRGCRCEPCREANRTYARTRDRRLRHPSVWGEATDLVPATEAIELIEELRASGMGTRAIAETSGLGRTAVSQIALGKRRVVHRSTLEGLRQAFGLKGGHLVDARPTWKLLEVLIEAGYAKVRLAEMLGNRRALQIGRHQVRLSTAREVENLYSRLWFSDSKVRAVEGSVMPSGPNPPTELVSSARRGAEGTAARAG